jgi:hypothetical protein
MYKIKSMRKIKILVFFVLLLSFGSRAQDSLFFSNTFYSVTFVDTTLSFTIYDTISNLGSVPFTGASVKFAAKVNNNVALIFSSPRLVYDSIAPSDTLYPGGGNYKALSYTVNSDTAPPFVVGTNAVVIWPIITINGTNIPINPADSIFINVTYDTLATGIAGTSLVKMYIFQTPGRLNINFGDAENLVQQVSIYDILGQGMYAGSADKSKNIPTTGWTTGVYLCEITTYSGEKRTIKFRLE